MFEKETSNPDFHYYLDGDLIKSIETDITITNVDEMVGFLRKKFHCDFEVIYHEHGSLTTIYRCSECGTVIFGGDDERWDPNLCCPVCSDYKPSLKYWTGEEIANDPKKQEYVNDTIKAQDRMNAMYERIRQRGGLHDWELWKKNIKLKNYHFTLSLECLDYFSTGLKGLNFHIIIFVREKDSDISFVGKHFIRIPLSFYAIYIQWIFPHTKKYKELMDK